MATHKGGEKLKDKIKSLFGVSKDKKDHFTSFARPSSGKDFVFTPEILKDIGPESPANNRIKTIKELAEVVLTRKLEENAIEALWCSIQDLVQPNALPDNRQAALVFLQSLLQGQLPHLGLLRCHFFNVIRGLNLPENLPERLALFNILSENGKNLLEFEEEAGPFLLDWMPDVLATGKISDFLELLISVIKYNAAYLDENIVSGFVQETCMIPNRSRSDEDIKLCLGVLDVVVCYSYLPSGCLQHFIGALCGMVNLPKYCEASWELMRKLLGTHLGHSSVYTMCVMLQDRRHPPDFKLLRGAVFFLGMALWGSRKVTTLKHTPAAVLPSFLQVLHCGSPIVAYEVVLSVQRLVKKYGRDLTHTTWDIVLDIMETVLKQLEASGTGSQVDPRMPVDVHDILTTVEALQEGGQFGGSVNRFFKIIEMCASKRPESSVSLLISHHSQGIHPGKENWVTNLYHLLDKYFRNEKRTKIRVKALDVLSFVLSVNKHLYEDDLISTVVIPHMCHLDADSDPTVRKCAVEILLCLAQGSKTHCFMDIIVLIEKIIQRPLVSRVVSSYPPQDPTEVIQNVDESHLIDIRTAVNGLTELFKAKLYTYPPGHCLKVYEILVNHMKAHYSSPQDHTSHTACAIRKTIVECLLQLRSDSLYRLGMYERTLENQLQYSPYVKCLVRETEGERSPPRSPMTTVAEGSVGSGPWPVISYLEYTSSFTLFIQCLACEKDWEVMNCVLENLPVLLQNKTLILACRHNLVDSLSSRLCAMVNNRNLGFPEKLLGVPVKFTRSDFHGYVFPVLASMVTYHSHLERNRQRELINCLEFGMVSKCAKMCVNALRLCTLEMHDVMVRQLPSVLLQLSKISATVSMAIPVLAFLSSIVRQPKMYANFVEDEYMSVFAIALPYTNPYKFSHYTVSLAHHVIAIWFIRCRMPLRKAFVQFIQKGLRANVLQLFEENARHSLQNQNQDSSDRLRSGSYSEAALRSRRRMVSGSSISRRDINPPVDEKMRTFHRELMETCTDVMSRYTFSNFAPIPYRSPMADFLLAGGQSQTWLVGNKLITITTSGGGTKLAGSGLCEKCMAVYQNEGKETKSAATGRRRHKSAVTFSRSSSTIESPRLSSLDDMTVAARSRDDLALEMSGQDVGVQTGSSLNEHSVIDSEPLESLILAGLKGSDPHSPVLNLCNCWCTNWAEIYIRAPSGNISWMMRIENEAGMPSIQGSQVPDITALFASMGTKQEKKPSKSGRSHRIESGSVGEEEYETLYAQYFQDRGSEGGAAVPRSHIPVGKDDAGSPSVEAARPSSLGFSASMDMEDRVHRPAVSQALQIPSKDPGGCDSHPSSLRRSNSSPSILSGSSDTLSPRESISDTTMQFLLQHRGDKSDEQVAPGTGKSMEERKEAVECDRVPEVSSFSPESSQLVTGDSNNSADRPSGADQLPEAGKAGLIDSGQDDEGQGDGQEAADMHDDSGPRDTDEGESGIAGPPPPEYHSMLSKQLSPSPASSEASSTQDEVAELPNLRKVRGHTISVVSPAPRLHSDQSELTSKGTGSKESNRVGISPSFVFLQLYHGGMLNAGKQTPILLPNNESTERALKILDHIYPYETHKIGVLYIGPGQTKDEKAILSNQFGSERYARFVQSLGQLFRLRDCDPSRLYLGGLDTGGSDGEFTYGWHDESTQLIFHVATLMPNRDPNCNSKKLHIGNDYVTVVYNDSAEDYKIGVITGQFNYVNIVIKPLDYESNAVTLQAKEVPFKDQITTDIAEILGHKDTKVISDTNLAVLVRQIAIHCNLASQVLQRQQSDPRDPFASNWLERLRKIRRIGSSIQDSSSPVKEEDQQQSKAHLVDFTEYV